MDHVSEVIPKAFHDSEIAKKFSCKRTKSAAIAYNVLGKTFEEKMLADLRLDREVETETETPIRPVFSIIIDESTDVSTTKVLAAATKYYSEKFQCPQTKFLCMIDLKGETAQDLFDSLNNALTERNLNLTNLIGFAADTTNVMFGERNSVVSKLREVNPNCIFFKCMCHSTNLSVSYACKKLPRTIELFVKEVYTYFSHSSQRQRELAEFQKFVDTPTHRMLRHYDIRWLSLYECIHRIVEQWEALKLFFHSERFGTRNANATCEFLFDHLNSNETKLYINFLDFILPITNKFNIIFQSEQTVVHNLHTDMQNMMSSILSCYMKINYVRTTPLHSIDPNARMHYVPLKNMYIGLNVAMIINSLKDDVSMRPKIDECLERCQTFLIELSNQFIKRMPVQDDLYQDLSFLDPQKAVYDDFRSLIGVLQRFPNLVPTGKLQVVDNEYRELKLDQSVSNLLSSSSSSTATFNVDKFWSEVGKMCDSNNKPKYENLSRFAKQMTILPVSNAKVERIFSDINRIKTRDRNRFHNKNVAAIMHGKEGLRQIEDGCANFVPDKDMLKLMEAKNLYDNINEDS